MNKRLIVIWVAVQLVLLIVALAHARAASLMHVEGSFTTRVVPCDKLCTESVYSGDLEGTSEFSLISMAVTRRPEISRYEGTLVLHTADGDLVGEDVGYWNTSTGGYVDTYRVLGGTGVYEGASGVFFLTGTLDPLTGTGASTYQGWILWPCDD